MKQRKEIISRIKGKWESVNKLTEKETEKQYALSFEVKENFSIKDGFFEIKASKVFSSNNRVSAKIDFSWINEKYLYVSHSDFGTLVGVFNNDFKEIKLFQTSNISDEAFSEQNLKLVFSKK